MKNKKNLQPWLDYLSMLRTFEEKGLLQTEAARHEAYVTQSALHGMTPGEDPKEQIVTGAVLKTVERLRAYAAVLAAYTKGLETYDEATVKDMEKTSPDIPAEELEAYVSKPFAVHVVKEEEPHDLVCTLLMTRRKRNILNFWKPGDAVEVIPYNS